MDIIAIINTSFHLSISFLHIGKRVRSQYLFIILIILYQNIYYFDSNAERKKKVKCKLIILGKIRQELDPVFLEGRFQIRVDFTRKVGSGSG